MEDPPGNTRPLEQGVVTDLGDRLSYAEPLQLDRLLSAQELRSDPPHHDELLFVVQHWTTELWRKLVLHELRGAARALADDDLRPALKRLCAVRTEIGSP